MQEKVAALKKALTSAERQLEEALKKEAEDTEALKKAEEDLEKLTLTGKKKGPRSRSQSRTRLSSAEEAAREAALKQKLTRQLSQLKLETGPSLKKEDSAPSAPSTLKKVADSSSSSKPLKKRPCVVVDWHNTLEEKDHKNVVALETLMLVVDVHIISWVGSSARFEKTMQDIQQWLPAETLKKVKSFRCIYKMVGAEGVFDDQPDVIQEALEWGLEGYPIKP